jgi:BlaI family penicillinase repressor
MLELNRNELEAMRVLWHEGALKPAEIQEHFSWPIENATLRSVLRVLMEKGQLTRRKKGRAFYYKTKASRRGVLSTMSRQMAHVFTGGSTADLIAQLIKTEKLSKAEIEELRQIAEARASEGGRGGKGGGRS